MPLPTYEKKDEIPKGFEELYVEDDDKKWVPKASKLETTLEKLKAEKKEEKDARIKAESERADLERRLAAASSGAEQDKVAKALKKFDDDLAAAKAEHKKEVDALNAELRTIKLDDRLKETFLKAGGRPEKAAAALELTKKNFDLAENRIVVKNEKGEVTTETAEDFYGKKYRTEMPEFYQGTKATGGGAGGGAGKLGTQSKPGAADAAERVLTDPLGMLKEANAEAAQAAA